MNATLSVRYLSGFGLALAMLAALTMAAESSAAEDRAPIYDESGNGEDLLSKAMEQAGREHKRVLIQWGGNWCGWCWTLHDVLKKNEELARTLEQNFVLVHIDTRSNEELKKTLAPNMRSVPYLTVVDEDRRIYANQNTEPFEINGSHDPEKLAAFLATLSPPPSSGMETVNAALAKASAEDKLVFLRFGSPGCGWCRKLDGILAKPEVNEVLSKNFIHVDIDLEHTSDAEAVRAKYWPDGGGGTPWFAFLDGGGKSVVTSTGPAGNIGCPNKDEEIAYFGEMLKKGAKHLTESEIGMIQDTLKAQRS